jgi:hypothetical protein
MTEDREIDAMAKVVAALEPLEDEVRMRVLRWAGGRYGVQVAAGPPRSGREAALPQEREFGDVAALYDAADPQIDPERALVVGYWFQQGEGREDLDAQTINTALKNLGHGISNITSALSALAKKKPALVRQIQKKGKTKQARKRYRLTEAGIREVQRMLGENATQGD